MLGVRRILATLLILAAPLIYLGAQSNVGGSGAGAAGGTSPVNDGIWVTPNDALIANTTTQTASPTYSIVMYARFLQTNGTVVNLKSTATVSSPPGSGQNTPLPYIVPPNGPGGGAFLVTAGTGISSGSGNTGTAYGQVFQQLFMACGTNLSLAAGTTGTITSAQFNSCSTATPTPVLVQGYTSSFQTLCWGNGISCPATVPSNQGFNTVYSINNPGAGVADAVFTPDQSIRSCIQSVSFKLTTSATAANRVVTVFVQLNGVITDYYVSNSTQTAGQTVWYSFVAGQGVEQIMPTGTGVTTPVHTVPMGPSGGVCFNTGVLAGSAQTFTVEIQGMQAADTLTALNGRIIIWSENN